MALVYIYPDAYLVRFCTEEREARAIEAVAIDGTFTVAWTERLVILQTYILACLENQADAEDLFTAKLKSYREQYSIELLKAKAANEATTSTGFSLWSIPMERA